MSNNNTSGHRQMHVRDLLFSQRTVSQSFSKLKTGIDESIAAVKKRFSRAGRPPFTVCEVAEILAPDMDAAERCSGFTLEVFEKNDGNEVVVASCDNRRLCMFKRMFILGIFDGMVWTTAKDGCHHAVLEHPAPDVVINPDHVRCVAGYGEGRVDTPRPGPLFFGAPASKSPLDVQHDAEPIKPAECAACTQRRRFLPYKKRLRRRAQWEQSLVMEDYGSDSN